MSETPPNEVPREAGEFWMFRIKGKPEWGVFVGATQTEVGSDTIKVYSNDYNPIGRKIFNQFDWHKIQLPEGWK